MTKKELDEKTAKLILSSMTGNPDINHRTAEAILCELLMSLGYSKTVEAFEEVAEDFWYA